MNDKVTGIVVTVVCGHCKGERRIPGGKFKLLYGEVVDCPVCSGSGEEQASLSVEDLKRLLST